MAIDPKLVSIKKAADLPSGIPTATGEFLYFEDETLKKAEMSDLYDRLESAYLGIITPSSTIPTTGSWYGTVLAAGTFNNVTPAITVDAADFDVENGMPNNEVRIIISEGVATKDVRRVKGDKGDKGNDADPAKLPLYSAIKSANIAAGTQFIDDEDENVVYRVKSGQTLLTTDNPANMVGTKVEQVGGSTIGLSPSENIYSPTHNVMGKYVNTSFSLSNATTSIYAKIPITEGTYTAKAGAILGNSAYNSFSSFYFEDAAGTKLTTGKFNLMPLDKTGTGRVITAPAGSAFLFMNIFSEVSSGMPNISTILKIESGDAASNYTPYEEYASEINGYKIKDLIAESKFTAQSVFDFMRDKNIAILGDSITAGSSGLKWVDVLVAKKAFKNIYNFARSGARWSHQAATVYDPTLNGTGNNVMWNQANALIAGVTNSTHQQPDVVVIKCGRNDSNQPLGVVADTFNGEILSRAPGTILTIAEGIRYTCETLLTAYPNLQIILVTPIQWAEVTTATWLTIGQTVKDCAKYLSVQVIDAGAESGIYRYFEIGSNHRFLLDGTHPNAEGNTKLGTYIFRQLQNKVIR